jgi:hypothetical protein
MDDKSTPIESLNNKVDDSEVVNNILSKYNNLQDNQPSLPQMEQKFEDRNLNQEIYTLNSNNVAYKEHYQQEMQRTAQQNKPPQEVYEQDDDDYEEYEVIEVPLWRRILNEVRIPLYIFIFILFISNCTFDKFLLARLPLLGNKFNECNTYGFILKAFLISILSYIFIRFIRF